MKVAGIPWAVAAAAIALALSALSCQGGDAITLPGGEEDRECRVTRVSDGDTIHVDCLDERVRLLLIDAPEVAQGGGSVAECFGAEAKAYLERRLPQGTRVRLLAGVRDRDRFERYLRYVFFGDELLDETLVREGYAVRYRAAEDRRFEAEIAEAEDEAKDARRGLWACPGR